MNDNYGIEQGYYGSYFFNEEENAYDFQPLGRMVFPRAELHDIETGNVTYRVEFLDSRNNVVTHDITPAELLGSRDVPAALVNKGAQITPDTLKVFRKCFSMLLDNTLAGILDDTESDKDEQVSSPVSHINVYGHVGFWDDVIKNDPGDPTNITPLLLYRSNRLLASEELQYIVGNENRYTGNLDLTPHGSFEAWREMIRKDVLPYPNMCIALLGGASSIITGLIGESQQFTSPIFHIYGSSGTGKSCTAKVVTSLFGQPFDGAKTIDGKLYNSVYGSWSGTENALRDSCVGNRGICIILNELGKSKINNLTALIYDYAEGTMRKRSNGEGIVNQREGFRTSFVTVGEFSLFDLLPTQYQGIVNRVMELEPPFTVNADHAKRLEQGSYVNCGFGGDMMASYILNKGGREWLTDIYRTWYNTFNFLLPVHNSDIDRFVSTFAAPILTTAYVAMFAWNMEIVLDDIITYLLDYVTEKYSSEEDIVTKNFETVMDLCERNQAKFILKKRTSPALFEYKADDLWGYLESKKRSNGGYCYKYWIYITKLEEICAEKQLPSAEVCVREWRNREWVETEKDHLYKRDSRKKKFYVLIDPSSHPYGFSDEIAVQGKFLKRIDPKRIDADDFMLKYGDMDEEDTNEGNP